MNETPEDIIIAAYQEYAGKSPDETLTTYEMNLGFTWLNRLISIWNADGLYIPFLSTLNFNFIPGIGQYVFAPTPPPDLDPTSQVWVESSTPLDLYYLNYVFSTIVYSVTIIGKSQYFQQVKLTNLLTLPGVCFLERQPNSAIVFIYPLPNIVYPATMKFKANLKYLDKNTSIYLPPEYSPLFIMELGKKLTNIFRLSTWNKNDEDELLKLRRIVSSSNEWSCSIITDGVMSTPNFWGRRAVNGSVIV